MTEILPDEAEWRGKERCLVTPRLIRKGGELKQHKFPINTKPTVCLPKLRNLQSRSARRPFGGGKRHPQCLASRNAVADAQPLGRPRGSRLWGHYNLISLI